jgi:hypothetical protein
VICSEVLEHVPNWEAALSGVAAMSHDWVLVTVPGGRLREHDRIVGHIRHFTPQMLATALQERGCTIAMVRRWGWPMHTAYRAGINLVGADRMYESFGGGRPYTASQRAISSLLYGLFYLNDPFRRGEQLIVLARKQR